MKLADKLKSLREIEGSLRGLNRAMTQGELVRAIAEETGSSLSQSFLSQIESGARPHLTNTTRLLLARFFRIHPGHLVDDPEGYHAELLSDLRTQEDKLDLWLLAGADRLRKDPDLAQALRALAGHKDSRGCLLLLGSILATPRLHERLLELYQPSARPSLPAAARRSPVHTTKAVRPSKPPPATSARAPRPKTTSSPPRPANRPAARRASLPPEKPR